ncbi:predicted protein [Coccidioides posadasii str. Silveira]|uniref:Predicted protein n=2 Tax=Coccidioides posadasii TaxID=199306 RepID=E9CYZ7_COCPS|nr:predicted protein [Coccidioides posadasii str. Silveira]KMM72992.1 hypothetical protein CPAG_09281 [Coccidioides posadasii RMSCC 3488]
MRDWAKEQRDEFIKAANKRHTLFQSQNLITSEREMTSEFTTALDDSDTSNVSNDSDFHGAHWSFAHPGDTAKEGSQLLRETQKKPRTYTNLDDSVGNKSLHS